jgi:two-component system cell cycle response regulator
VPLLLADNDILSELADSGRLPSPTGVALTILEISRNPDSSTEDMATVLQGDPALSGQILKFANSADSGSRCEITNLNDALVRMGMAATRQLCLGFSVLSSARSGPCPSFDYQHYWAHSLGMAVSAQAISKRLRSVSPDEAFTCGLLCGIGQLALASVYPYKYDEVLRKWVEKPSTELKDLEKNVLSIDHGRVSAVLMKDWGLPEYFSQAAEQYEAVDASQALEGAVGKGPGQKLAILLHFAQLAADICLENGPQRHQLVLEFMQLGKTWGYSDGDWITMYDEILTEWGRMGRVLNILTSNVPSMEDLINRANSYRGVVPERRKWPQSLRPGVKLDEPGEAPAEAGEELDPAELNVPARMEDSLGKLHILVASDSPVDRRILEKKLAAQGHTLTMAEDGKEALEKALETRPQLIITDWMMPEMDGLELSRTLRLSKQAAGTYIIIMTAQEGNEQLVEAFAHGIDDYVTKPINHPVLTARMRAASRIIEIQEAHEETQEELRQTLAELSIVNRQNEHMAMVDQLTDLPNRRAGLDRLDQEWARSLRSGESLLCMVMDIDHFKRVNDDYGHDAGDIVLQETAAVMKATMRDSDTVCRFGGEEFLVICPGADVEVAKMVADRIRQRIEQNHIQCPEFNGNVTISIGVAVKTDEHESAKDMIKDADEALYAAKEAGRNLVCIAG